MLKKLGLAALALVVVLLVAIVTQPDTFRVERSATIAAPAPVVFHYVNDLHTQDRWNPWVRMDSTIRVTHAGAPAGVGAVSEWTGRISGAGRQEIVESRADEYVKVKLDFHAPINTSNVAEYTIRPAAGGGVTLTWAMSGPNTFFSKAVSLVASMDKMVGTSFEQGLGDLKAAAEADATQATANVSLTD